MTLRAVYLQPLIFLNSCDSIPSCRKQTGPHTVSTKAAIEERTTRTTHFGSINSELFVTDLAFTQTRFEKAVAIVATQRQSHIGAKHRIRLHHALEIRQFRERLVDVEHDGGDELPHGAIDIRPRTVVSVDSSLQHLEVVITCICQNIADVLGGGVVDFRNVVLVCNFIDADWRKNAADLVVGGELDDLVFVVHVRVDELEKELKVRWVIFVKLDDFVRRLLHGLS